MNFPKSNPLRSTRKKRTKGYMPLVRKIRRKKVVAFLELKKNCVFGLVAIFSLFLFFSLSFIMVPRIIKVNKITCKNQYSECNESFYKYIENSKNLSLYAARKKLEADLSKNYLVNDFTVYYSLPSGLEVYIIEKKAKYALLDKNNRYILIDKDGEVVSSAEFSNLPTVITDQELPETGDKIDERTLFCLETVYDLYSTYQVRVGSMENNGLVVELMGGPRVIFPQDGDRRLLLGSFNLIYSRLNSLKDESKIEYGQVDKMTVDLRFKNPIIR